MTKQEAIIYLGQFLNDATSSPNFNGRTVRFLFNDSLKDTLEKSCAQLNLALEFNLDKSAEIRIDSPKDQLFFYFNEEDFVIRSLEHLGDFSDSHYVILVHDQGLYQKEAQEPFSESKMLFFNFYFYNCIFKFLEEQEGFMHFYAPAELRFVLFTSEKGPFDIQYDLHEGRVKNLENLEPVYLLLQENFKKIDFVQFFKAAVINSIHGYAIPDRFFYLVQSLRVIINLAIRDHYVYIRNFDFDKIKTKFREERNKYFETLEKNIDSIKGQVTSFPLTFGATIFVGYQVKEKPAILILVFLAYSLYTLIAWRILSVTLFNITSIETDVKAEEKKIKGSYEVLYDEFKPDFDKIYSKIGKINDLIDILKVVLVGLLICFLVFGLYQFFFVANTPSKPIDVRIVTAP